MDCAFLRRLLCLALAFVILNASICPAFGQELPSSPDVVEGNGTGQEPVIAPPEIETTVKRAEFTCHSPDSHPEEKVLDPKEVAKLKRLTEVDNNGFELGGISSGFGSKDDRDDLENNAVVKTDGETAILQEMPKKKMEAGEIMHWFNRYIPGPFAFGVSLYDTVRIGRCNNLPRLEAEKIGCPVQDKQLEFRNSGEGIVSDFKSVWKDVEGIFEGEDEGQYTPEQLEKVQVNLATEVEEDRNALQAKFVKRETELILNSVKTEDFTASMGTNCNDNSCLISSYSFFDKYFNSWFSTEMVVSNFGPVLFGQAKRYLGWMTRKGWPWSLSENRFANWFRREYMHPDSLLGKARAQRMVSRADEYGFGEFWTNGIENSDWTSGYKFMKGSSARKWINDMAKPGGYFSQIDDPVRKGEFFKLVREMRGYARTNKAIFARAQDDYMRALGRFKPGSAEAQAALVEYGRTNGKILQWMDDSFSLDAPEWWVRDPFSGMYPMGVKPVHSNAVQSITGDSKHIDQIMNKFIKDGDWKNFDTWGENAYEATSDGFLQLYRISDQGELLGEIPVEDLQKHFTVYVDKAALTAKGELIKITGENLDYIVKEAPAGSVKIYKATWAPFKAESPVDFAGRLTHSRVKSRLGSNFPENMDRMYNALVEQNFAGKSRHYYSLLDKAFAQEDEILKSYFSVTGGLKWTALPLAYWQGKRGFGFEGLSAYQLPDTWKNIEMYTEQEEIYDDAFVDFFAQHGSDEGDLFGQVLNYLPWKMVYNYVWEEFLPAKEAYDKFTKPTSGWRRSVENVAYFSSTRKECATCKFELKPKIKTPEALVQLKKEGKGEAVLSFNVVHDMQSYLLEDVITDSAKEEGSTLIAFGHHTNIKGDSTEGEAGIEGGKIDLVDAQKDKTTCKDKVKDLGLGFLGEDPQRAAAILAFGESALYFMFFWSGIVGSVVQQTLLVPELQDCVDDLEGYYVHIYAPAAQEKEEKEETPNQKGSKIAGDAINAVTDFVTGGKAKEGEEAERSGQDKSWWEQTKTSFASWSQQLGDKARTETILQADVQTQGTTDGTLFFKQLYYLWFKGNTMPSGYDDQTKMVMEDKDNNVQVVIDKEKGVLAIGKDNGPTEPVLTSKDHVRLSGPDGRIPAQVIPQRIGQLGLPTEGEAVPMFEMDWHGNLDVLEPAVLECIRVNVEEQTGVALATNKITDAFGRVEKISTDVYLIVADEGERSITATGAPRQIVYGENARVVIMSDRSTTMMNSREVGVGKFKSINFKNGVILYKPAADGQGHELLIWLRHHEQSILEQGDVSGLRARPATYVNPETDCPEPAINLEALPNLSAGDKSKSAQRVENFNLSMEKMGPFQTLDTEKHRFVFYTVKTSPGCNPSDPECCQDRVKIINKETGEIIDEPLVGELEQTPTGIKFTTLGPDGQEKEHSLDFSAENGVPKVSYNGDTPETLLSARGPNGAFWYDPDTGMWYPENSQLLPLLESFKQQGFETRHRAGCSTTTEPGSNSLSVQFGSGTGTPFNLPSLPEQPAALLLFIAALIAVIAVARVEIERRLGASPE